MVNIEITKDLVKKVAKNARLELTEEELERFTSQIKDVILDSFNKLDEIDVSDLEASFQPIEQKNKFRKDEPNQNFSQDEALKNVIEKLKENGYIKGPKAM
ncbi:MAG: Asp-tRNA(Asn)/Glu-tRNA(Gln) amidotransferase subunit GatC [Candidatus ainarchaeum sp.]|nr:Asp-tRNA(Asn)/Glu-tRNA(Gln) amidotransferase subunit GatC [Candidatus ainarchaeum sp.]